MSTGYNINGVDMGEYFPVYEDFTYSISSSTGTISTTFTLTKNRRNTTNYMVISQPWIFTTSIVGTTLSNISTNGINRIIYDKTPTSFKLYLRIPSQTGTFTGNLWLLVIYLPVTDRELISSISNYNINSTEIPINNFPQIRDNVNSLTTNTSSTVNVTFSTDLTVKNTTSTDYFVFTGVESTLSTQPATIGGLRNILFYIPDKTATNYTITFQTQNVFNNTNIVSMALYLNSISNNNTNTGYRVSGEDLIKIFPTAEYFSIQVNNATQDISVSYTLQKNTSGTTNYLVFGGLYYSSSGTGGTYSPWNASGASYELLVTGLIGSTASTTISLFFRKNTGDIWNGGVYGMVLYL